MDLDWLARETLAINSHVNHFINRDDAEGTHWISQDDQENLSNSFIDHYQSESDFEMMMFPQGQCGVLWRLDSFEQVFCLRSLSVSNAREAYQSLKNQDTKLFRKLRIEEFDSSQTFFFPTPSLACAEVVSDSISNQRFPYYEDSVSNLSDPSVHWKLEKIGDRQMRIHFQNIGSFDSSNVINLGPLGSSQIFRKRCYDFFEKFGLEFDLLKLDADDRYVHFSFDEASPFIPRFIEFFEKGQPLISPKDIEKRYRHNDQDFTSALYFSELAYLRKLWLQVQSVRKRFLS